MNERIEPRSDVRVAAAALMEFYVALIAAGFNDHQAITIIGHMLAAGQTRHK